jgi:hypothetical protein
MRIKEVVDRMAFIGVPITSPRCTDAGKNGKVARTRGLEPLMAARFREKPNADPP